MKTIITTRNVYLVTVNISLLIGGDVATSYVMVLASNEEQAIHDALIWFVGGNTTVQNNGVEQIATDRGRDLEYVSDRAVKLSDEEVDIFASLTTGISKKFIIDRS